MERRTGQFTAFDDERRAHTIYEYTDFIDASSITDPHAVLPDLKALRTVAGDPINYVSKGIYKIVATGEILRSNETAAP